jgi:steroid 5-alpha reductase family enzyme
MATRGRMRAPPPAGCASIAARMRAMTPVTLLLVGWLVMAAVMTVLWLVQRARRDAGIVDVGWAAGLGLLAVLYAILAPGAPFRRLLVGVLAGAWSLRLASYILTNRVLGGPEDGRYQTLRSKWGERAQSRFFLFFQAQALVDVVFSIPYLVAMSNPRPGLGIWGVAGFLIWLVAVLGEALADRQLAVFRADSVNLGKVCRVGLWRASRHPNYFFEWLHWWSYVLLAVGSHWWVMTLVGPALMFFFLFKVTGIPATEAQALASRGEDYRDYQRTTSAFVPWFPSKQGTRNAGQREPTTN